MCIKRPKASQPIDKTKCPYILRCHVCTSSNCEALRIPESVVETQDNQCLAAIAAHSDAAVELAFKRLGRINELEKELEDLRVGKVDLPFLRLGYYSIMDRGARGLYDNYLLESEVLEYFKKLRLK